MLYYKHLSQEANYIFPFPLKSILLSSSTFLHTKVIASASDLMVH